MSERRDLDVIAGLVPVGSRVLDLGCGSGELLAHLVQHKGCSGYGIELDDANLQASLSRGIDVIQLNLEEGLAMFGDASFDVVLQLDTLQHLRNAEKMLIETARSIYREGGILKRLRATPLSPVTILGAHVAVKLGFTAASLALLVVAGRQLFPGVMEVNTWSFGVALLLSTLSILSLGFVIASVVPTARFAQPISAILLYPMLGVSGIFFPLDRMPQALKATAWLMPTTHAVGLLQGVWDGSGWGAHWPNVLMLVVLFVIYSALSTRVFRWE